MYYKLILIYALNKINDKQSKIGSENPMQKEIVQLKTSVVYKPSRTTDMITEAPFCSQNDFDANIQHE